MRNINIKEFKYVAGCGVPATTANKVGAAAIVGAITGIPGGPAGVIIGAVSAATYMAIGSAGSAHDLPLWMLKGAVGQGDPMCQ